MADEKDRTKLGRVRSVGFQEKDKDVEMEVVNRKERKPAPNQPKHPEREKLYWVGNMRENISKFFKFNAGKLKRGGLQPTPEESTESRTWLFFFMFVQLVGSIVYGFGIVAVDKKSILILAAIIAAAVFALKILSIILFWVKRLLCAGCCRVKPFDDSSASSTYKEILVVVPVFHESKNNLKRLLHSVAKSEFPKHKLYLLFVVDGNKLGSYENLMEVLRNNGQAVTPINPPASQNYVEHGTYKYKQHEIFYSVYLKPENRGYRDCKWVTVELLRSVLPEFRPNFTLFLDSDTAVHQDAIRALHNVLSDDAEKHGDSFEDPNKRSGAIGAVCGKLRVANFKSTTHDTKWDNLLWSLSTIFIVGHLYSEYIWNDVYVKRVEDAYDSVTHLPGALTLIRTDLLCDLDSTDKSTMRGKTDGNDGKMKELGEDQWVYIRKFKDVPPVTISDFFGRPLSGMFQRGSTDIGFDRALSAKLIARGFKTKYEPNAVGYTECPDSISTLLQQKRRWITSEFFNGLSLLASWRIWIRIRTIPVLLLTFVHLVNMYLLPVNALLVLHVIWKDFIYWANETFGLELSLPFILFWWIAIQFVVMIATKLNTSDMFFALNSFLTGLMMAASMYFFINFVCIDLLRDFSDDVGEYWAPVILLFIYPLQHVVVSLVSLNIFQFFAGIFSILLFPTISLTIYMYSFINLDDFTWGTR